MPRVAATFRSLAGLALVASALLSACGQKRDGDPLVLNAKTDAGQMEDKFGNGFGKAFRANPNAEPRTVSASDVKPVSLTAEPVLID